MYVTHLIKKKEVKEYLNVNFQKPKIEAPAKIKSDSFNPSLTGNACQMFLQILYSRKRPVNELKKELSLAEDRIEQIYRHDDYRVNGDSFNGLHVSMTKKTYCKISGEIIKKIRKIKGELAVQKNPVSFFSFPYYQVNSLQIAIIIMDCLPDLKIIANSYTIYDAHDLAAYYNKLIGTFKESSEMVLLENKVTMEFAHSLLVLNFLSSPTYYRCKPFNLSLLDKNYIKKFQETLQRVLNFKPRITGNLSCNPSLKCWNVFATPDFLVGNKLVEVKTTTEFFTLAHFHQVLMYLLFSQHSSNKKVYGNIDKVILYYTLQNQTVELDKNILGNSIKHLGNIKRLSTQFI